MEERRRVHEFNAGSELHVALAAIAAGMGGGDRQHRTQSLAAGIDQVACDFGDQRHVGTGPFDGQAVDPLHPGSGGVHQRRYGRALGLCFLEGQQHAHFRHSRHFREHRVRETSDKVTRWHNKGRHPSPCRAEPLG
jgi:hypothetical protein